MCVSIFSSKASCNVWNFHHVCSRPATVRTTAVVDMFLGHFIRGRSTTPTIDEGLVSLMGLLTIMIPSKSPLIKTGYIVFVGFWQDRQLGWVGPLDSHDERSWLMTPTFPASIPSQVINPGRWLRQQKRPVEFHEKKTLDLRFGFWGKERQVKWTKNGDG